jgi:3-methyladenine DNA glycosylase/8-oxoguanine DNA glycosylase
VKEGSVDLDGSWSDINGALAELPGFGPWTRTYLAIRLGREADAFPASDIGLLRATGASTPAELLQLAESWRPFRAYAAAYLWMHG